MNSLYHLSALRLDANVPDGEKDALQPSKRHLSQSSTNMVYYVVLSSPGEIVVEGGFFWKKVLVVICWLVGLLNCWKMYMRNFSSVGTLRLLSDSRLRIHDFFGG